MSKIDWTAIDHPISGIYSLRRDCLVTDFAPYVESLPAKSEELVVVTTHSGEAIICHLNDLPSEGDEDFKYVEEWINKITDNSQRLQQDSESSENKIEALKEVRFSDWLQSFLKNNGLKPNN